MWLKPYLVKCGQSLSCRQTAERLAAPDGLHGDAREFKLPDGRTLQYLRATSKSKGKAVLGDRPSGSGEDQEPDTLKIDFWRIATEDGGARVLRLHEDAPFGDGWLSRMELVDRYCESQCSGGWTGQPDVIAVHGRTFIFGPYQAGTHAGYVFLEVMPAKLKFLGWYRLEGA